MKNLIIFIFQSIGMIIAFIVIIILLIYEVIKAYTWDKLFPKPYVEFEEPVYPKLNLPQLGCFGQHFEELYDINIGYEDIQSIPINNHTNCSHYEVEIIDLLEEHQNEEFIITDKASTIINNLIQNWNHYQKDIKEKTKLFLHEFYNDSLKNLTKNEINYLSENYFKILSITVLENEAINLGCDNIFDEEHGLQIYIENKQVKIET